MGKTERRGVRQERSGREQDKGDASTRRRREHAAGPEKTAWNQGFRGLS